jgi:hypothetical protein
LRLERRQTGMACRFEQNINNKGLISLAVVDAIARAARGPKQNAIALTLRSDGYSAH